MPWRPLRCSSTGQGDKAIYGSEIEARGSWDDGKSLSMNASDVLRHLATLGDPQLLPLGAYRRVIPGQVCTCRWSQMYRSKNRLCHIKAARKTCRVSGMVLNRMNCVLVRPRLQRTELMVDTTYDKALNQKLCKLPACMGRCRDRQHPSVRASPQALDKLYARSQS